MSCSCGRLLWRVSPCGVGVYSRRGRSPVAGVGTPCGRFPLPALSVGAHTLPARVLPARALLWRSRSPARTLRRGRSPVGALCSRRALCSHPPAHSRRSLWRSHSPARTLSGAGVYSRRALSLWRSLPAWLLTAPRGRSHTPRAGTYAPPGALRSLWRGISRGAVLPARSPALLPLWARTLPLRRSLWRSHYPARALPARCCVPVRALSRGCSPHTPRVGVGVGASPRRALPLPRVLL